MAGGKSRILEAGDIVDSQKSGKSKMDAHIEAAYADGH